MVETEPHRYRDRDWPIHVRWFWYMGRRVANPAQFRAGRGSMYPTPGGRWKVRQTRSGKFLAYVDAGKSTKFKRAFPTHPEAMHYALAMAYIARYYSGRGLSPNVGVFARIVVQRMVYHSPGLITQEQLHSWMDQAYEVQMRDR